MSAIDDYRTSEALHESRRTRVLRARRLRDDRAVVLKIIGGDYPHPARVHRLGREFQLAQRAKGPGVIEALAMERDTDRAFIVFEDFGGSPLCEGGEPALDQAVVLDVAIRLTEAIARLHALGITHKDVTPANVLRNRSTGEVKLIDFGLATERSHERPEPASPAAFEGTLLYMSPEQTGRLGSGTDRRTDLYSLGATLYHLATGRPPFASKDPLELLHAHLATVPTPACEVSPAVSERLSAILDKLLVKAPERRYQTAHGVHCDLLRCRDGGGAFELGRDDARESFSLTTRLYGREAQLQALLSAFDRAAASGSAQIALVAGPSGSGKSSLVQSIYESIAGRRGRVGRGKFDQLEAGPPRAAWVHAIGSVVRQFLAQPDAEVAVLRARLLEELGSNAKLVADVFPELALLLGEPLVSPAFASGEAQNRFDFAFGRVLRALVADGRPLVLVLDDLQWADAASLRMLEIVAHDTTLERVLVVGAYRDDEVDGQHPLATIVKDLSGRVDRFTRVTVGALDVETATLLVADAVRRSPAEARGLAAIAVAKTGGNPFFLSRFLEMLHADGLLVYERRGDAFAWDDRSIAERRITDNVVDLMAARITRLSPETREIVSTAAALGNEFNLRILAVACGVDGARVASSLSEAIDAAIIVGASGPDAEDDLFRFSHDRVHQAAYSRVDPVARESMHLEIGRRLAAPGDRVEATHHRNLGRRLLTSQREREDLARDNLSSAKRAFASAAYGAARAHLRVARELLSESAWDHAYDLQRDVTRLAADAACLSGDFTAMDALVDEALARCRTLLEKAAFFETRINGYVVGWRPREALACAAEVLGQLGVSLPLRATKAGSGLALVRSRLLAGRAGNVFEALPPMRDPAKLAAVRVLASVATAAYNSEPDLYPVVIHAQLRLTVEHGMAPESPFALVAAALMFAGVLGDVPAATALGELAVRLAQRPESLSIRPRTEYVFHAFVAPWSRPLRDSVGPCEDAYRRAREIGDVDFACLSTVPLVEYAFYHGEHLDEIERRAVHYAAALRELGNDRTATLLEITSRACLALSGRTAGPVCLSADDHGDDELLEKLRAMKDGYSEGAYHAHKLMLAYLGRDFEAARRHADAARRLEARMTASATVPLVAAFGALADLASVEHATPVARARTLLGVAAAERRLRGFARHAPENYAHWVEVIRAERARLAARPGEAWDGYRRAIALATKGHLRHFAALVAELAGRFCLQNGETRLAETYLRDARDGYADWGATARVRAIEAEHPTLARPEPALAPYPTASSTIGRSQQAFDLLAVTRASQAISGEIVLGSLLEKLMRVVLESAGAQRGALVVPGSPRQAVFLDAARAGDVAVAPDPGEALGPFAALVMRLVERTGEPMILADATAERAFPREAALAERPPRSVLCIPIRRQARLVGVLYLENDLVSGAFTIERCALLEILSAQAAISIENARLYETLEERVRERTAELGRAQERLGVQEKLASLGRLTSGIAHELRNPLNFINNFAAVGARSAVDAQRALDGERERLPPATAALLQDVLTELRENAAKIQEHGGRAERVVRAMLAHSREGSRALRQVDWNELVRRYVTIAENGCLDLGLGPTVHFRLDPGAGMVTVAPEDIGRVLVNLTTNALASVAAKKKALGAAFAPRIDVSTKAGSAGSVEARVRDNGVGIPEGIRAKVFEPFFTTKAAGEGTGLGLSISHEIIVRGHGGELGFESVEGEFAEFHLVVPRTRDA